MEAQAALVGANGGVELYAVAAVYLGNAVVIDPGNTESDDALRLDKTLEEACLLPLGVLIDDELQALKYFADRLKELGLIGIALLDGSVYTLEVFVCNHFFLS